VKILPVDHRCEASITSAATALTDKFDRALLYATHVHGGQVCKETTIPYVAHLLAVAATVLEYGGSEDMACKEKYVLFQ
jgi:(p)ppGpp synthase/HD superfamily hydrolase